MVWDDWQLPRRLFGLGVLLALLVIGAAAVSGVFVFDLRIGEDQLNRSVAARLPLERKTGPVTWRVEAARLQVLPMSRIAVGAEVRARTTAAEGEARVAGSGVVAFRDGAFWLSDIDIDGLDILGMRAASEPGVLGKALGGLAKRSETARRALERAQDAALSLGVREAEPALNAIFKSIPVYRLRDDWKGTAARASLLSIRTEGRDLVATLDPVGKIFRLAALAAFLLIAIYAVLCVIAAFTNWLGALSEALLFWW